MRPEASTLAYEEKKTYQNMIERGGKKGKRKEKRNLTQQTGQDPSDRFSSLGGSWLVLAANLGEDDLGEFVRMPPHEIGRAHV